MFGRNFQKGMEAGVKPFAAKFEQYSEALKRLEDNFGNQWYQTKEVADDILDTIDAMERAKLYGLHSQFDIKELEPEYKDFVVAVLYTLSSENTNELQQSYIRSVQKYLDINTPQTQISFSGIENIESLNVQQALFQICVEYLLLGGNDPSFFNQYQDNLFCFFSINEKAMLNIWENVLRIYTAAGPLGLSEKYGFVPKSPEGKGGSGCVTPVELEDETIKSDIHIPVGEEKVFYGKNIRLNADIHCEGNLVFDNCVILYDFNRNEHKITIGKTGLVKIQHCTVIGFCKGDLIENRQHYFIESNVSYRSPVIAYNSIFKDCYLFANAVTAILENCKIHYSFLPQEKPNRIWTFIYHASSDNSHIKNCLIENNQYGAEEFKKYLAIFKEYYAIKEDIRSHKIDEEGGVSLLRDLFNMPGAQYSFEDIGKEIDKLEKIDQAMKTSDSIFYGIKTVEYTTFKNIMQPCVKDAHKVIHCTFENCLTWSYYNLIETRDTSQESGSLISDCLFLNCENIIQCSNRYSIKHCQFIDCRAELIKAGYGTFVSYCEFYNYSSISSCNVVLSDNCLNFPVDLLFIDKKSFRASQIEHCTFDGIRDDSISGFIFCHIDQDWKVFYYPTGLYVKDCNFKHSETRSDIIRGSFRYSLSDILAKEKIIKSSNCTGLDNVNKEGNRAENIKIRHESGMDDPIGARLDEVTVGVPGYTADSAR